MAIDWRNCPAVRMELGYVSGAAALHGDPRVPAETVVANMDAGMSAGEVMEMFGLKTPLEDVVAVYKYARDRA